uniref:Uncharacterized protein n=1 Tax=Physcomitrium patens TaxID=3218 RepID=A9RTW4_PHYPA|nr:hypothetical protein PHYPA_001657 [Physcomitrium patens]
MFDFTDLTKNVRKRNQAADAARAGGLRDIGVGEVYDNGLREHHKVASGQSVSNAAPRYSPYQDPTREMSKNMTADDGIYERSDEILGIKEALKAIIGKIKLIDHSVDGSITGALSGELQKEGHVKELKALRKSLKNFEGRMRDGMLDLLIEKILRGT